MNAQPAVIDLVAKARAFAVAVHGNQMYGTQPYSTHLDAVVGVLRTFRYDSWQATQVGYLHDVLEDTPTPRDVLADTFGDLVCDAVLFCTDAPGPDRKTRKALTYDRCRNVIQRDWVRTPLPQEYIQIGLRVKLADRLANLRNAVDTQSDLLRMYLKESAAFRDAYYVPVVCDDMWAFYDGLMKAAT